MQHPEASPFDLRIVALGLQRLETVICWKRDVEEATERRRIKRVDMSSKFDSCQALLSSFC